MKNRKIQALFLGLILIMAAGSISVLEMTKRIQGVRQQPDKMRTMEEITVGFAQGGNPNPWMRALTENMAEEAEKRGAKYVYTDANDDLKTHAANIENMLSQGVDILIVAPMENTGLEQALDSAKEMKVPVILVGRTTVGEHLTTVFSNQAWEGERCAELIGKYVGDTARVVEIRGIEGTSSVQGRARGFRDVMSDQFPGMKIVAERSANFSFIQGQKVMEEFVETIGAENIDAVYAHNDEMGLGAIQAIKDAGLVPGKDIKVVSIDGQKEALDAIVANEMVASVQCTPRIAPVVFDVIQRILNHETIEPETIVPDKIFTKENAFESYDYAF